MYCETTDGVTTTEVSAPRVEAVSKAKVEQSNAVLMFMGDKKYGWIL
jgi:hypothetical protein